MRDNAHNLIAALECALLAKDGERCARIFRRLFALQGEEYERYTLLFPLMLRRVEDAARNH